MDNKMLSDVENILRGSCFTGVIYVDGDVKVFAFEGQEYGVDSSYTSILEETEKLKKDREKLYRQIKQLKRDLKEYERLKKKLVSSI